VGAAGGPSIVRQPVLWRAGTLDIRCAERTLVMAVLNVTPDSFSDRGRYFDHEAAVSRGIEMAREGADIIDVGGESTRPGARTVPPDEEVARVSPVVKRLAAEIPHVPISIDTRKASVAGAALDAGASIVNDVSGGAYDEAMFEVVRESGAGMILMHMRGDPATMRELTKYTDVVSEVCAFLSARVRAAVSAGIPQNHLAVDPGLGFAKTADQSLLLMRRVARFGDLGYPVVVGPSRKSFVGLVTATDVDDRMEGTAAAVAWLSANGAHVIRVHDVRAMIRVTRMIDAIRTAGG
jgi:dihydropteroate synthase